MRAVRTRCDPRRSTVPAEKIQEAKSGRHPSIHRGNKARAGVPERPECALDITKESCVGGVGRPSSTGVDVESSARVDVTSSDGVPCRRIGKGGVGGWSWAGREIVASDSEMAKLFLFWKSDKPGHIAKLVNGP